MDQNQARPRPLRDQAELRKILSTVLGQIDPDATGLGYRLVGTSAALLQGVELPAGDIDILVSRRDDVDSIAAALSRFPCLRPPVWLPDARQYFAHHQVDGIGVEASTVERPADTDALECIGAGPWQHYVQVQCGKHRVPAVRLELRLVSELYRDRPDRYLPLIDHMRVHGAELQLVQKGMAERGVQPALQARVLDLLRRP
ncbi:hypothetical protein [Micromonospora sp. HK10]|uniref:hypothetical protein n=1 Tax=Micromonospora sp. HK10 TaxID=1538294 RepID=UPI00062702CE|nr:hypothetical protein [Micromonospora sp. HK10]